MSKPLLGARGVVKRFGHVKALQGADFTAYPGEVVPLIGDHGAGRSTPVNGPSGVSLDGSLTARGYARIPAAPLGGTPSSGR